MDPIEQWWTRLDIGTKEWLREHGGAEELPDHVREAVSEAGGPAGTDRLGDDDWQFIALQSETPD